MVSVVTTRHGEQVLSATPPAQVQGCVQTVRSEGRERTEEQDIYVLAGLARTSRATEPCQSTTVPNTSKVRALMAVMVRLLVREMKTPARGQGWWRQQVVCVAQGHVAGTDPKHALQGLGVRPAVLTARSGR